MSSPLELDRSHPAAPSELPLSPFESKFSKQEIEKVMAESATRQVPFAAGFCLLLVGASSIPNLVSGVFHGWVDYARLGAVAFAAFFLLAPLRRPIPVRWTFPALTLMIGMLVCDASYRAYSTGDMAYSNIIALCILCYSTIFLNPAWFFISSGICLSIFGGAIFLAGLTHQASVQIFYLLSATVGAFLLHRHQVGTFREFVRLKLEDAKRFETFSAAILEARASERRFQRLSESSREALILHTSGQVTDANRAALEMLKYQRTDLIGKPVHDLLASGYHRLLKQVNDPKNDSLTKVVAIQKGGEPLEVMAFNHLLVFTDGPVSALGFRPVDLRFSGAFRRELEPALA